MSDWSGVLYRFYSNKNTQQVFEEFTAILQQQFDFKVDKNSYKDESYLLFYQDETMLQQHLEYGYRLDKNGLGCVGVESKRIENFNAIASLHTFDDKKDFEPYDIHLTFDNLYYFTLVLPEPIENSHFALAIFKHFKNSLLD